MLKKINHKLENIFDDQSSHAAPEIVRPEDSSFEPVQNLKFLENLSYIFTNIFDADDLHKLTQRLSCFFPFGIVLTKSANLNGRYEVSHSFSHGKTISFEDNISRSIILPETPVYTVLSTPAVNVISKLNLPLNCHSYTGSTCYSISLSPTLRLIVASASAEPWATLEIETLQQTLMKINFNL